MNINITPALQIEEKKNLSAEEFQKQLCSWLENRGLLSELRAYFRSNMIEVLKNTALGSSISCKIKQPISPKMQAINLLISEYFICSQYHFSLCVFCTEVSLNNILPNVNNTVTQVTKARSTFKFSEKEVYDILEAVGLLRYNTQAQKIYTLYCQLDEPLISYFMPSSSLTSIASNEILETLNNNPDADFELTLESINKILSNCNMSPKQISLLKCYINNIFDKQNEKQTKAIQNLKEQYKSHLRKYKSKLVDIQESFENERQKFQHEIDLIKQELDNVLIQNELMKKSQDWIQKARVTNLSEQLQQTELRTEQKGISAGVNLHTKSTQCEEEKPKKIFKFDEEQQTLTNCSLEAAVLKHVVQQLEKENNTLRTDNYNYCEQIDELANRASILMSELNISQQHVIRLNNLLQNTPSTFLVENVPQTRHTLHYTGAGEECSGSVKNATPGNYRNLNRGRKFATKKPLTYNNFENTSGSSSPTDDLLQEAKRKLKSLELESEHIDHKIRSFTDRNSLTSALNQNKSTLNVEKHFKFTQPHDMASENVFKFGASSSMQKDSNINAVRTLTDSQTSITSGSTSCSRILRSRTSEED